MSEICNLNEFKFLNKPYKLIAFDWDGTAVKNRQQDARHVSCVINTLLNQGVIVAIVTGTNINNIIKQLSIECEWKCMQNLFIFTNRGSEIYSFFENGELMLIHTRQATKKENMLLDKIASKIKKEISSISNTDIQIISNRLNRRKIDLIPHWKDPQKSEIGKLLEETENNLSKNGFSGGIKQAYELLTMLAKSYDFNNAKITTDVKHLEIGLTDKSDSIRWILDNIAKNKDIKEKEILIGGDEFGTIAGFQGSDFKMLLDNCPDITYFSVGIEPEGSPPDIIHIGGGPEYFCKILEKQIEINTK